LGIWGLKKIIAIAKLEILVYPQNAVQLLTQQIESYQQTPKEIVDCG
jgi:hypothetical protein